MEKALLLIPILPFLGFLVNGLVGKRLGKGFTALIACMGPIAAFGCALFVFARVAAGDSTADATLFRWIRVGDLDVPLRFVMDRLSGVLALVVTGIGSLIHLYSTEYMEHETRGGYARYFAYLNLFMAMMLVLILGSSLPLLFVGWEGVGLASYLLIGFWYQNLDFARAGRKAFIVNRIGDFAFLLGMFLLFTQVRTLDLAELGRHLEMSSGTLATAAICLFIGACGKSAQIPLYVWLPDAMAGPTPVSALIHAATMVTAGVYMVLRLHVLFHAAHVLPLVAAVGVTTAFFAATMGLAENDLKKVLAYSTISQLGYMFLGAGAGAFSGSLFHLVTHAFFKALLFLGAGAVMHALGGTTDLRKMGGLREKLPLTYWLFLAGALALAGIPPFAGFFSKDEILAAAFAKLAGGGGAAWFAIWLLGVLTAGLTAFYTFRAFALAFLGEPRGSADAHMHAHEPGTAMRLPLVVLAAGAACAGFLNVPRLFHGAERFGSFLGPVFGAEAASRLPSWLEAIGVAIPTALGILCALGAVRIYSARPEGLTGLAARPSFAAIHDAAAHKYWIDEVYDRAIVQQVKTGAVALWEFVDVALIDNAVNGVGRLAAAAAQRVRRLQGGVVNTYAFYVTAGAVMVLVAVLGYL